MTLVFALLIFVQGTRTYPTQTSLIYPNKEECQAVANELSSGYRVLRGSAVCLPTYVVIPAAASGVAK